MKHKIQKLLSILLSAAMLVGLMSTSVFAETQEVTNILATITAPELGAAPDYEPTYVSTPSSSVNLSEVVWFKLAEEDYTGSPLDPWEEMVAGETFTAGYYYNVDVWFAPATGYTISDDITGSINGMPHFNIWNQIKQEQEGEYIAIISGLFLPLSEPEEQEVTNITVLIDAPKLGQTPDYEPTYVSTPSGSLDMYYICWYKIAEKDYTGTNTDSWDVVLEEDTFTTGYYYNVDIYFATTSSEYTISDDITATINGKPHCEIWGGVKIDSQAAYVSQVFQPLKKVEYVLSVPVNVAVKLNGDEKPGTETFKLEIFDCGVEDAKFEILNDTLTAKDLEFVDGVAYFDGVLKIKVDSMDELYNLTEGFKVRMVKGSAKNWTYASEVWYVNPVVEVGPGIVDIYYNVSEVVDGEISDESANGMLFTVSYGVKNENSTPGDNENPIPGDNEDHTPSTGDTSNLFLWISLLLVSCFAIAGVALFGKQKKVK